nr:hypothetical protein [Syntrophotalea acetylenica]
MMRPAATIYRLGIKELWSLARDPAMLILIVYTFTAAVYIAATAMPDALHKTPIAIVDEDDSPLSARIATAFYPPYFMPPAKLALSEVDPVLDAGEYSFVLDIPPASSATCWPGGRRRCSSTSMRPA